MNPLRATPLALLLLLSPLAAQTRPGLSPLDVLRLRTVTAVAPGPDGKQIAFLRSQPRQPSCKTPGPAFTSLYLVPAAGGAERTLIEGERSLRELAWSPDGQWLTYVERREPAPHPEVWALPMAGGEPQRLTTTARGVHSYQWRPDGGALAFTMADEERKELSANKKLGFQTTVFEEQWSHVSLWLWDKASGKSRQLTRDQTVFSFQWAPDGRRLAVGLAPHNLVDDSYMFTRLHVVDADSGKTELLVDNPGKLGHFAWSPDSRQLAYVSAVDRNDPHAGMLFVVEAGGRLPATPRALMPDLEGMVNHVDWADAQTPLVAIGAGTRSMVASVPTTATSPVVAWADASLQFTSFAKVGSGYCMAASAATHPAEVFVDGRRLTTSNPWLAERALGRQSTVRFKARDGLEIEGVLIEPVGWQKGTRRPLVILVHGGPEAHLSDGWLTSYGNWGQVLAARGWFAWYPNYRASTGRGVKFAKLDHGDPMGREFEDHLDAIAWFDQQGLIDPARVGIGGGSYGGYTAAYAATRHTQHFAAAVSFVPFVDIKTKWCTSDIPSEFFFVHYQEKWPYEPDQERLLRDRSPLAWAQNCKTPLLLLGGTADPRVHPSQPFMLYRAVKLWTRTPVRYVQYPGEGHGNATNIYQYDYLVRSLQWLDHYLKEGDHRSDPPPPPDLDLSEWDKAGKG